MLDLGALALLLEQLEVAGRALERREAARAAPSPLNASPPVGRGDGCRRADEPAEKTASEKPASDKPKSAGDS